MPTLDIFESHGCKLTVRRVAGHHALELFFSCTPPDAVQDAGQQAEAAYRAISEMLASAGGGYDAVVMETVFLQDLRGDIEAVRGARAGVLEAAGKTGQPARTEIEQPPLVNGVCLELAVQAVVPTAAPGPYRRLDGSGACDCPECARTGALVVPVGDEVRCYAGGIYGRGQDAYEQTRALFDVAEGLLVNAGMTFGDVMRTWIYLPEMERDYPGLNRGRHEFFQSRGIEPVPASTGIGAGLVPDAHSICMGFYAVRSDPPTPRQIMTTPTLNEAPVYGSDFARGMRVDDANKTTLYVSGTASLDETGATVHVGDVEAQAERMLLNVSTLLAGQGAGFGDVVSAITYLKHADDAPTLRRKFHEAGYEGFPNSLVVAPVCRPELLCETEAIAVPPAGDSPTG